ncbi:hypothetical protein VE02_07015 [Pseudogymnoascus sp. 03VT05]|nr:hypothetical protein VE02_07015 [Pseudogymnoascus sp. 03VT05]
MRFCQTHSVYVSSELRLHRLVPIRIAGFPPGVINLLGGDDSTGALMASHMGIKKISYTGSVSSGRKVQIAATNSNLKRVTLELSGKSPSIIFKDADLENALVHSS